DDGEHHCGSADPERENEQRNGGKTREPAEGAERVADVARHVIQPARALGVAVLLLDLLESTELEPHPARRLAVGESRVPVRLQLSIDVKPQLVVELTIDRRSPEHRSEPMKDVADHCYAVSSTRATTEASFRQALASASSWARPFRVSS